jgi:hypothetical protein
VIDYQLQLSQALVTSPAPERSKYPHNNEELNPAKRMRLTPQLHENLNSSNSNNDEATHISDLMPDTATNNKNFERD